MAMAAPGTLSAARPRTTTSSKPSRAWRALATGSAPRTSSNGNEPPPCANCPEIFDPSGLSWPLKVGSPGTPEMTNMTFAPSALMPARGRSLAPWSGMEMSPFHVPSASLAISTSTASLVPGRSIAPSQ
ncbi:MAG: hypothetical protein MZV64_11400 [Ignavibacteriales bacterium]|nr:hypothetical protein [Ignavibacteriales bacterium]